MDVTEKMRGAFPDPHDTIIDAEIWSQDSTELHEIAETLVNRHPRFAWMVVEMWLTKHNQHLIDNS